MRLVARIFLLAVCTLSSVSNAFAIDVTSPPPRLSNSPIIMSAYYISGSTPGYFELYNSGSEIENLRDYSLTIKWSTPISGITTQPLTLPLASTNSYLPSHQYTVVGFGSTVYGASIGFEALSGSTLSFVNEVSVISTGYKPYVKSFTVSQTQRMMLNETSTGYTTTGTYSTDTRTSVYDNGLYAPEASDFPLAPIEILANPKGCSPTNADVSCNEYVKFYNSTNEPIKFDGTRLRIGYQGQTSSTSSTILLGGTIAPGQYAVFDHTESGAPLSISNTGGYVWLEDTYGLVTYPSTVVEYPDASSDSHKGQSWMVSSAVWQWGIPSPAGGNKIIPVSAQSSVDDANLAPCRADQYRNPETNRCKLIETVTDTACDVGEYRNPDTGRCKKITTLISASLQPCDEGQYRNPETNRCKSIASQSSALTPCDSGWERNPETNRCRKVASSDVPKADFAVEQYQSQKGQGLGWVAFATVGTGIATYGMWEWRSELASLKRRLLTRRVR